MNIAAFSLDAQKARDRAEWGFLGFGEAFIKWKGYQQHHPGILGISLQTGLLLIVE